MPRIAHLAARKSIVAASREMNRLGINQGTSGNIGLRIPGGFLVTPTGIPADELEPHMIVRMGFDGRHTGAFEPSSEWRFHRDILVFLVVKAGGGGAANAQADGVKNLEGPVPCVPVPCFQLFNADVHPPAPVQKSLI